MKRPKISVIIPALNASSHLASTLLSIRSRQTSFEVIVVDGGSNDNTLNVACRYKAKTVVSRKGRGIQLNAGAKAARGDILFFLHADTAIAPNALDMVRAFYQDGSEHVCKFMMRFDREHWLLRFYSFMTRFDSLWTSFGDQGIIVRRSVFKAVGGFEDWPLFEDVRFFQKTRTFCGIRTLPLYVRTSARYFNDNGIIRQQLRNAWLIFQYLKGVSPELLYKKYYA